jgi:hypothetical protein
VRVSTSLAPLLVLGLLACGDGAAPPPAPAPTAASAPEAAPKPPSPAAESPHAAGAVAPTPAATGPRPCCADAAVTPVLRAVLDASAALAADDDAGSSKALEALVTAVTGASGTAAEPSKAPLTALESSARAAAGAADMAARREAYKAVSKDALTLAGAAGGSGELTLREAFCPMAGAGWLQTGDTVANPYYGAEMLTCGSFK